MLASGLAVAYSLRFVHDTFFGEGPRDVRKEIHEPPVWMKIPVLVLVTVCLLIGVAPGWTIAPVLALAARGVLGDAVPEYSLAVWHGFNLPLAMSAGGVLLGIGLYFALRRLFDLHAVVRRSLGRQIFQHHDDALLWIATRVTRLIANERLHRSLILLLLAAVALAAAPAWQVLAGLSLPVSEDLPLFAWVLWFTLVAGTVGTVALHRQRLPALVVIGVVGLAVSLLFVLFSAPDLALTQLLVEMLTVALVLLALNYLPQTSPQPTRNWRRIRDGVVALAAGVVVAVLAYAMLQHPLDTVAGELLARSWPEGHGRNVVNVILVDFRGLDTLGEITVFAVAALVVHALLRAHRLAPDAPVPGPRADLPMPAQLAHLLFPLALAVSAYLFLRGHNEPGGGFIAGLVLVMPVLLQYVLLGARHVEGRMGFNYVRLIAVGLLLAATTGVAAWLFRLPFLSSGHVDLDLPLLGTVSLTSAIAFDMGVYLVVFGGAMLVLSMLGTVKPPLPTSERAR
ncbi:MAG TPA: hydrogen gas-evolving membrane-bound hydrogenase subunit E [Steroidobacteraceae bacterium]|nr:hydrogen gas-evolving membrane-bound hydrogenase subunit E [Steroidobacteraceae bacterium]